MRRIGLAASKMAHGNVLKYNVFVVLIAFLFSFLIFLLSSGTVVLTFIIIDILIGEILFPKYEQWWMAVSQICLMALAVAVGIFYILSILVNIKVKQFPIFQKFKGKDGN